MGLIDLHEHGRDDGPTGDVGKLLASKAAGDKTATLRAGECGDGT